MFSRSMKSYGTRVLFNACWLKTLLKFSRQTLLDSVLCCVKNAAPNARPDWTVSEEATANMIGKKNPKFAIGSALFGLFPSCRRHLRRSTGEVGGGWNGKRPVSWAELQLSSSTGSSRARSVELSLSSSAQFGSVRLDTVRVGRRFALAEPERCGWNSSDRTDATAQSPVHLVFVRDAEMGGSRVWQFMQVCWLFSLYVFWVAGAVGGWRA